MEVGRSVHIAVCENGQKMRLLWMLGQSAATPVAGAARMYRTFQSS